MPNSFWLILMANIQNIIGSIAIVYLKRADQIVVEGADAK